MMGGYTSFGSHRIVDLNRYAIATNTWKTHRGMFLPVVTADAPAGFGADGRIYMIVGTFATIPRTMRTDALTGSGACTRPQRLRCDPRQRPA